VSFGTLGALTGGHPAVWIFVVCGDGCSLSALVLVVIIITITIVVVVVVVLDTWEPVAVVLDQSGAAEPQLIQLLPQLVPLLLLLLLPGRENIQTNMKRKGTNKTQMSYIHERKSIS